MICPNCQHPENRVLETRIQREGEIRRRRECFNCNFRFTTSETIITHFPHVIKKDGRREPFSRDKLFRGIQVACRKRPISMAQIDGLVTRITRLVQSSSDKELPARVIGQAVIEELRKLDDVAYVRFASVYKNFRDINEFVQSLAPEGRPPKSESETAP